MSSFIIAIVAAQLKLACARYCYQPGTSRANAALFSVQLLSRSIAGGILKHSFDSNTVFVLPANSSIVVQKSDGPSGRPTDASMVGTSRGSKVKSYARLYLKRARAEYLRVVPIVAAVIRP